MDIGVGDKVLYKGIQRRVEDRDPDVCPCEIERDCKNHTLPNIDAVYLEGIEIWVDANEVVRIPSDDDEEDEEEEEDGKAVAPCDECDGEGVVALGSGAQTYFGPCPKCNKSNPEEDTVITEMDDGSIVEVQILTPPKAEVEFGSNFAQQTMEQVMKDINFYEALQKLIKDSE